MSRIFRAGFLVLLFILLSALGVSTVRSAAAPPTSDENWTQFLGLNAGVAADYPALPESCSPTENVIWKLDVPGNAWSSPIVREDFVFVTTVISDEPRPTPSWTHSSHTRRERTVSGR